MWKNGERSAAWIFLSESYKQALLATCLASTLQELRQRSIIATQRAQH
jgi:hypothetical protein